MQWSENRLGWHEEGVHEALLRYGDQIIPGLGQEDATCSQPARVFVPLCGKAVDMAYLAKSPAVDTVVGVDGIRKALETFREEHPDLEIVDAESGVHHERMTGQSILLLKGDYFALDEAATGGRFDAIFDRASMVAIEPSLRAEYVNVIGKLLKPGGKILLVALEKRSGTDADKEGPPFSLLESDIRSLYENQDWIESVTLLERKGEKDRNKDSTAVSIYYLIQAKK